MTDPGLPPKYIEDHYTTEPNSGFAGQILQVDKPGYRFFKLVRQGDRATVVYKRYP